MRTCIGFAQPSGCTASRRRRWRTWTARPVRPRRPSPPDPNLSAARTTRFRDPARYPLKPRQRLQPAAGRKEPALADLMDAITSLAKRRGFVFPSSEIYGGLRSSWDYGPLGVELKNNLKRAWWRATVQLRDDVVGLDAAVIMSPRVWAASGHLEVFTDPLVECLNCHQRFRADHLPGVHAPQSGHEEDETTVDMAHGAKCPNCGHDQFTEPRNFNLMFKT